MTQADEPQTSPFASASPGRRAAGLFLISVLGLFLELMLIRWIGTEIRIFAYLQNTVLVVCFLGLGMGCLSSRRPFVLRELLLPLFLLVAVLTIPQTRLGLARISALLSVFQDFLIWTQAVTAHPLQTLLFALGGLALTFLLLLLIWDIFVPVGRLLGQLMDDDPQPIRAYSLNVAGSLLGIWLFVLLSVLFQPPLTWLAVFAALCLYFVFTHTPAPRRRLDLVLLAALVVLGWFAGRDSVAMQVCWSPYQKLVLYKVEQGGPQLPNEQSTYAEGLGDYLVNVNNVGYQIMINLSKEHTAADDKRYPKEQLGCSQYDIPFLLHPRPRSVLIVGAGTGNDAAGALRNGAQEVVAVDIDPAIIAMGRAHHPEQPYQSPAVRVVIDDARSYLATTTERFDLIDYGLLDSHTMTAMTNARLDHYVYTRESFERARGLLSEGGLLVLSFGTERDFIADRIARSLQDVFGQAPICFRIPANGYGVGGVMFVAGDLAAARGRLAELPRLKKLLARWQEESPVPLAGITASATDDWPYLYLETPHIPVLYLCLAALLPLLLWRGLKRLRAPDLFAGWDRGSWHFFFLGAAFMLLEVQNISKASVVLGNTWEVNAVIISCILALILLANLVAAVLPRLPLPLVYGLLCGSCLLLYWLDLSRFGFLPYVSKAAIVGGLTSLPIFFSGIIFIRSFANVSRKDLALGANLIGALVGGVLQSVTFLTGIKALLLIVTALYIAALLTRPRVAAEPGTA